MDTLKAIKNTHSNATSITDYGDGTFKVLDKDGNAVTLNEALITAEVTRLLLITAISYSFGN